MKLIIVVAVMLLSAAPLMAETYSWEDERGTANFTENYSSIPLKYRKHARKLGDMGSVAPPAPPAAVGATKTLPATAAPATSAGAQSSPAGEENGLFGGKKPEVWQQQMRPLYMEIKRQEQQLAEIEALIRKPTGISKSRMDGLPQEFRDAQAIYNQNLKRYNSLNDEANRVGLPAEFRK